MKICLEITIKTNGESEDDVYKHLCNILYDSYHDITEVCEVEKKQEE